MGRLEIIAWLVVLFRERGLAGVWRHENGIHWRRRSQRRYGRRARRERPRSHHHRGRQGQDRCIVRRDGLQLPSGGWPPATSCAKSIPDTPTSCLPYTDSDQDNVIASLVGRSLGFDRVVTSIGDPQFEDICHELGLKDTIIPSRTISRYLEDMVGGGENVKLSTVTRSPSFTFDCEGGGYGRGQGSTKCLPCRG